MSNLYWVVVVDEDGPANLHSYATLENLKTGLVNLLKHPAFADRQLFVFKGERYQLSTGDFNFLMEPNRLPDGGWHAHPLFDPPEPGTPNEAGFVNHVSAPVPSTDEAYNKLTKTASKPAEDSPFSDESDT